MRLAEHAACVVNQLWKDGRFTQGALARRLGIGKTCAHRIVQMRQPVTMDVIEAVAGLTGIPLVELLARHESIRSLTVPELKLIEHFRALSRHSQRCLEGLIELYAKLTPQDLEEQRALHELRHLPLVAQRHAYAYLMQLHEMHWTPDLLGAFEAAAEPPRKRTVRDVSAHVPQTEHWQVSQRRKAAR